MEFESFIPEYIYDPRIDAIIKIKNQYKKLVDLEIGVKDIDTCHGQSKSSLVISLLNKHSKPNSKSPQKQPINTSSKKYGIRKSTQDALLNDNYSKNYKRLLSSSLPPAQKSERSSPVIIKKSVIITKLV